ncbi:dihydrofolate reductase [Lineolata rhizophorae]|uniref:2,5-diamino-6-ribosylamino-4(3H)-pyrimidinone 5'-phosphate reductase n=1 Tax=Lineolata rhizophorae TaxID=578093 RepID=A0A6A6NWQ1_9PEZI|nr:dihydrofolate reductase [Lineolata rhizophorae]
MQAEPQPICPSATVKYPNGAPCARSLPFCSFPCFPKVSPMPPTCLAFVGITLDGFISRPDGSIDYLAAANKAVPEGEDCGYKDFMKDIDALILGRKTFEQVLGFDKWSYGDLPVIVISSTLDALPSNTPTSAELCRDGDTAIELAEMRGYERVYVDGGETVRGFVRAKLLDQVTLTTVPLLLGSGRPLFGGTPEVWLELLDSHSYPFGFVQSTYRLKY